MLLVYSPRFRVLTGIAFWVEQVNRYTIKWRYFLGGSCSEYLERVAQQYIRNLGKGSEKKKDQTGRDDILREIDKVNTFQMRFRQLEAEILQEDGAGERLVEVTKTSSEVGEVIWCLEDLLSQAMVSRISFEAMYTMRRFMYQVT